VLLSSFIGRIPIYVELTESAIGEKFAPLLPSMLIPVSSLRCKEMLVFGAEVVGDIGDPVFAVELLLESMGRDMLVG